MHDYLEGPYTEYRRCHMDASKAESSPPQKDSSSALTNTNPNLDPDYLLPIVGRSIVARTLYEANLNQDRDYRKACILQQGSSLIARAWYSEEMPVRVYLPSRPWFNSYMP